MDKYFEKFPITTSDFKYEVKHLIGVIKYATFYRININMILDDPIKIEKIKSLECLVEYDKYNKEIQIDCVNIPESEFIYKFNDLISNVMKIISIPSKTKILISVFDGPSKKYYSTNYGMIKDFKIIS